MKYLGDHMSQALDYLIRVADVTRNVSHERRAYRGAYSTQTSAATLTV